MLYGEVELSAEGGLHWLIQFSRVDTAEQLTSVLKTAPQTARH
jgi:hypothetical protein